MSYQDKKVILCFTSKNGDIHTKNVFSVLEKDFNLINLDTEQFGVEWGVALDTSHPENSAIIRNGNVIYARDIQSVWWRKPSPVNIKYMNNELASFVYRESNDLIYGFLFSLEEMGIKVLNHPLSNYFASMKPRQLILAKEIGFFIPDSTLTNNPEFALKAIKNGEKVSKGVSMSWAIDNGINYPIFIKKVTQRKIENISKIRECPATIQEKIDKLHDVRIIVVENDVFYFTILDSNNNLDWREGIPDGTLTYRQYEIDDPFKSMLIEYNKKLGLKFSAFDFVVDKERKMFFLETNPNGQWYWLDETIGFEISRSIAKALIS